MGAAIIWDAGQERILTDCRSACMSSSQMAKTLNISRGAVLGKLWRMGFRPTTLSGLDGGKSLEEMRRIRAMVKIRAAGKNSPIRHTPHPPRTEGTNAVDNYEESAPGKTLVERAERGECTWPLRGDGADTVFCGKPATRRWCDHHWAKGHQPENPRNRRVSSGVN